MTLYETLLWLHVTFASLWVGGAILLTVLATVAQRSNDRIVEPDERLAHTQPRVARERFEQCRHCRAIGGRHDALATLLEAREVS